MLGLLEKVPEDKIITFTRGESFKYKNISIKPFKISHDAIEPSAFSFKDAKGNKIVVLTDLGKVDETIYQNIENAKLILLESNYEEAVLAVSEYPSYLKRRISSEKGHLSNKQAMELTRKIIENGTEKIIFGHLSRKY